MYENLTEKEISFLEAWYDPIAFAECIFPVNHKAPQKWSESQDFKCVKVRHYQFVMVDYSTMYADDKRLKPEDNYRIKKVVGTLLNIAARDLGKSYFIWVDSFSTLARERSGESMLAAPNREKLDKIAKPLLNLCREHPLFEIFKKSGKIEGINAQHIEVATQAGHTLYGRNENIDDVEKAGEAFHSIHAKKKWYEEFSYATKRGQEKGVDSEDSLGCIERLSGIPDIRENSPLGDILSDKSKRTFICRLPQYVRPDWSVNTRESKAKKYKGRNSTSYKLNVEAEILEGASSKWDMERIRKTCVNTDRYIKYFEINKEIFDDIETFTNPTEKQKEIDDRLAKKLILVKYPSVKRIVASDIGTSGSPSEVAIFFGDKESNFKYEYQISLFKMTTKEQAFVFDWLYRVLDGAFIALDRTNADGEAISERLIKEYKIPAENVCNFKMSSNIIVGFSVDENGKVLKDDKGKPIEREVYTKKWAVQQLEEIFYEGKVQIPVDEKFLEQFANHFETSGTSGKPSWGSSTDEHLVDTFLLFGLCVWDKCWRSTSNIPKVKRVIGII